MAAENRPREIETDETPDIIETMQRFAFKYPDTFVAHAAEHVGDQGSVESLMRVINELVYPQGKEPQFAFSAFEDTLTPEAKRAITFLRQVLEKKGIVIEPSQIAIKISPDVSDGGVIAHLTSTRFTFSTDPVSSNRQLIAQQSLDTTIFMHPQGVAPLLAVTRLVDYNLARRGNVDVVNVFSGYGNVTDVSPRSILYVVFPKNKDPRKSSVKAG